MKNLSDPRILAKDPARRFVLRTGLGIFGVGTQWQEASEADLLSEAYAKAPVKDSFNQFGTPEHAEASRRFLESLLRGKGEG